MAKPESFIETPDLLKDRIDVEKAEDEEYDKIEATATDRVFDLPLKAEAKVISILILEKEDWQQDGGYTSSSLV